MAEEQPEVLPQSRLSKEQKIGFTLLLAFGVVTILLGAVQLRNTLYAPFALTNTVPSTLKDDVNTVDSLRYRDTDHDGLTDFQELYEYHTSPYLFDTFGYGISDKEVLSKGLALCPGAGKFCTDVIDGATTTPNNAAGAIAQSLSQDPTLQNPPTDLNTLMSDPQQLRTMLISAGMDPTILKKISDKDLIAMANQLLATSSTLANQLGATSTQ